MKKGSDEPPVTEADVATFLWLSAEEKAQVLAKFHARGVKKDYLDGVKLRGKLLHLCYTMPGAETLFQTLAGLSGGPKVAPRLVPQEWVKPTAPGKQLIF